MSILSALPLGKIIGAGFAGVAIASPFAIKHLSSSSSSNTEQVEKREANCWLVMQGTNQKEEEQEKQLIVCKDDAGGGEEARGEESQNPKAKYYLRPETDKETKKEVESIKVENGYIVTITLSKEAISVPSNANNQENIQITQIWNLGDNLKLNSDCRIAWQEENGDRKKLICTPAGNKHRWLDAIYD